MTEAIGRYKVLKELGRGAMGVVYQAEDPLLSRMVAIKTILMSDDAAVRGEYETRFMQEAKAAGGLNHPGIVTIYDVGREGDRAYMAMELIDGTELRDMIAAGRLPLELALDVAAQVAEGLAFAHERGVVHRDVKPANIMIVRGRQAKIMDFGLARLTASQVKTQTGMVLGSPQFMSPEQIAATSLDGRSDIFSLGVVLYQMVTGAPPFAGENISQLMYMVCHAEPLAPSEMDPTLPPMLDLIVSKALAKSPKQRYQKAGDMAADLVACRAQLTLPPAPQVAPAQPAAPPAPPPVQAAPPPPKRVPPRPAQEADDYPHTVPLGLDLPPDATIPLGKAAAAAASARRSSPRIVAAPQAEAGLKVSRKFDARQALRRLAAGTAVPPRRRRNLEMPVLAAALTLAAVGAVAIAFT